jgi:hypothetical protein
MTSLADFQREFLDALIQPLGAEDRTATPFDSDPAPAGNQPASSGNPAPGERILAHIAPSAKLGARERFALYQRQYWYRIIDSLAEDFPRTRNLLGEERFWRCVEPYLAENPPRDYTLLYLGHGFAGFLEHAGQLEPAARPWASALARAEYAKLTMLSASDAAAPANLDRIRPAPAVWYRPADSGIVEMLESGDTDLALPDRSPTPSTLLVIGRKRDFSISVANENPEFLPLLEHLSRQRTLSSFFVEHPERVRAWSEEEVGDFFRRWNQAGWFTTWDNGEVAESQGA